MWPTAPAVVLIVMDTVAPTVVGLCHSWPTSPALQSRGTRGRRSVVMQWRRVRGRAIARIHVHRGRLEVHGAHYVRG